MRITEVEQFRGEGEIVGRPWHRASDDIVPYVPLGLNRLLARGHPGAYAAELEVVEAVNTALILDKPLLVTGKPGGGKSELAERIAYEFDLGAVIRFEAQSLSEANDLFYRFDYIQQMVQAKLFEVGRAEPEATEPARFVTFGALGQAILRAAPARNADLMLDVGVGAPRRSVVLIDEIDKASRDFPNDLLNGIERMKFEIRELGNRKVEGAGRDSGLHPIVVITSNSERDLPAPFLRRCVFVNIPDPSREQLAAIVRRRVFGDTELPPPGHDGLPPLYSRMLDAFVTLRANHELRYQVGTSELLDICYSAQRQGLDGNEIGAVVLKKLSASVGALAKHPDDRTVALARLAARIAPGAAG